MCRLSVSSSIVSAVVEILRISVIARLSQIRGIDWRCLGLKTSVKTFFGANDTPWSNATGPSYDVAGRWWPYNRQTKDFNSAPRGSVHSAMQIGSQGRVPILLPWVDEARDEESE